MAELSLPDLITLTEFDGDWDAYYEEVYELFIEDFITSPLVSFKGKRMGLKRQPITAGKEATFYHLTHEGSDEQNRQPDFRRMERIRWVKFMIANCDHEKIKMWRNKRGNDEYILIYHEEERYLVVLADRGEYVLPWTAYLILYDNRKRSLLKEAATAASFFISN